MAGFSLSPELLAQVAKASFQPPQEPRPGFNLNPQLASMQRPRGFGVGDAMALAGLGLQSMRPTPVASGMPAPVTPGGPAVQPGQMTSTSAIDRALDPSLGTPGASPNAPQVDPLTGLLMWVGRQFRPRGA